MVVHVLQPLADVVVHVERGYRMEAPEGCPPEIYTIMTDAWKKDPRDRPTFATVLSRLQELQAVTVWPLPHLLTSSI